MSGTFGPAGIQQRAKEILLEHVFDCRKLTLNQRTGGRKVSERENKQRAFHFSGMGKESRNIVETRFILNFHIEQSELCPLPRASLESCLIVPHVCVFRHRLGGHRGSASPPLSRVRSYLRPWFKQGSYITSVFM